MTVQITNAARADHPIRRGQVVPRRVLVHSSQTFLNPAAVRAALGQAWGDGKAVLIIGERRTWADRAAARVWRSWGGQVQRHPHRWAVHPHSGHTVRRAGEDITVSLLSGGGSHVAAHNERHQRLPEDHNGSRGHEAGGTGAGTSDVVTDALARARRRVARLTRDTSDRPDTTATGPPYTDGESRDTAATAGASQHDGWAE